jgi:phosphonate transport system substrate-binding protein
MKLNRLILSAWFVCGFGLLSQTVWSQPLAADSAACPYRGDLDTAYCDADRNGVADLPPQNVLPKNLYISITSTEDANVARATYGDFIAHLGRCLKRGVFLFGSTKEAQAMEAMRTGQVHIAQFATGSTMFAVNFAGAVPFAAKGLISTGKIGTYSLLLLVKADSAYKKPTDLKGKRVAHTSASSNSGNLAPRALFPRLGLAPDTDYKVEYSGKHDNSVNGVLWGLYDGAAVASDVFERMVAKGEVKRESFRVIYQSDGFPNDQFSYAHDLEPKLAGEIKQCFYKYKWPENMIQSLEKNDAFFPVDYKTDWQLVRTIAEASGKKATKAAYQQLISKN